MRFNGLRGDKGTSPSGPDTCRFCGHQGNFEIKKVTRKGKTYTQRICPYCKQSQDKKPG